MKGTPVNPRWQKSSYCSEGASCIHISATREAVRITESADPTGAILTTTRADFGALLAVLKGEPDSTAPIEITFGEGNGEETSVHLHETNAPQTVVTTDRHKWDAFILGVRAGEFDHFSEGPAESPVSGAASHAPRGTRSVRPHRPCTRSVVRPSTGGRAGR